MTAIAIIGMACRYPDASSPGELWDNALAQRRAFRRIPAVRLRVEDYFCADRDASDGLYIGEAAVLKGYEFDRIGFRIAGPTYRSADPVHWLALDVASQALEDAGFPAGEGLPRETTGVLLGNTLTGEFSRANTLRLRWPYVRRVLDAALVQEGWSSEPRSVFLNSLEDQYKKPFPPITAETLAGGLSNTIAGRICNHFDLQGGGYTVDGACSSSLLAVTSACTALVAGDLDVAVVGGVDLSLDPFELIGFARTGALAPEEMRVYDARSNGFWPGEGCGFVVLMRAEEAVAQLRRVYATIRGWGVSSDGSGGITRPEVGGQLLALRRAYRRAGYRISSVAYFEGHGTGTSVGDATELTALSTALREAAPTPQARPAIGSIKANIGHTKAAAGVAGLIKATMALHQQLLPPTSGCTEPHPLLTGSDAALRIVREGTCWPAEWPLRAGVSAMGFGGINAHLTLESMTEERRRQLSQRERALLASPQDAELFLFGAGDEQELVEQVEQVMRCAAQLARGELTDLAAQLERQIKRRAVRAAIVAASPAALAEGLEQLRAWLNAGASTHLDQRSGVFLSRRETVPRLGFLFPGQGAPVYMHGGAWGRRFARVAQLYERSSWPATGARPTTAVAQPAIVTASLAALRVLHQLQIEATAGIGHSLGEITALHWAGAFDEQALLRIASVRGQAMAELGQANGAMASIGAGRAEVESLLNGELVVISGFNSPVQTTISGVAAGVSQVMARAQAQGWRAVALNVSHAFHSPLVAGAAAVLEAHLAREQYAPLQHRVASTITGKVLPPLEELRPLLCRQVTEPVRFVEAVMALATDVDLLIEVGPGSILTGLVSECSDVPTVALDACGPSLKGLLQAAGAAYVLGAPVNHHALFNGRFARPFSLDWQPHFLVNPCELAPLPEGASTFAAIKRATTKEEAATSQPDPPSSGATSPRATNDALMIVRELVAARAELPLAAIKESSRLLDDLHLNSITVGQLVVEAAQRLGLPRVAAPTDYAAATVSEIARALESQTSVGVAERAAETTVDAIPGVDTWVRSFTVELVERPRATSQAHYGEGRWRVLTTPAHPMAGALHETFARLNQHGHGLVVCLPPRPDERQLDFLLESASLVLSEPEVERFVLVQHGGGAAAFARTLHQERAGLITVVVDVPAAHPEAVQWVRDEAISATGYTEAHYDSEGRRREPVLRLQLPGPPRPEPPFSATDVLLVTGGGKGIAAECAFSLARETGVGLALLGRSEVTKDATLAANLDRMKAAGVKVHYAPADVTDAEAVRVAVKELERALGPVTGILYGAGKNEPQLLRGHVREAKNFYQTIQTKTEGARNVLAAVDRSRLRHFIAFGSIIARTGMRGEADYALANEWLARITDDLQKECPSCRCLTVEWSIWSGVGMGERLGRVEALLREGITPITPDQGLAILHRLLGEPQPSTSVVVSGRFGQVPTLHMEQPELPLGRFFERVCVYYPGIELITEAELSTDTDPYLEEHQFQGTRLFPAVMGLEAMAQAAMALAGQTTPPWLEDVQFARPVAVPPDQPVKIRLVSLVRDDGQVEVALRSEMTGFQIDHFRAVCRFGPTQHDELPRLTLVAETTAPRVPLRPEQDLYGGLLFQGERFQRLRGYHQLGARQCLAEIAPDGDAVWFGHYLPSSLVLGDPAARDATIHAIQACVPQSTILPVGVERLWPGTRATPGPWLVSARERSHEQGMFVYDVEVTGADGRVRERWEGLRLQVIGGTARREAWIAPLLGPYLERRLQELPTAATLSVAVDRHQAAPRPGRSERTLQRVCGERLDLRRRPDGRPEVSLKRAVSTAHTGELTIAASGPDPLACDIETVISLPEPSWRDLLGPARFTLAAVVAQQVQEDQNVATTRVWSASECLKKAGAPPHAPLVLSQTAEDGWVLFSAGPLMTATYVTRVRGSSDQIVIAVLVGTPTR